MNLSPTIAHELEAQAALRPRQSLVETTHTSLSYADVNGMARALRGHLAARGVQRGDQVALIATNRDDYLPAVLAVVGLGAVLVPVNPALRPRELEYILRQSRSRAVLVENETRATVDDVRASCPDLEVVLNLDIDRPFQGETLPAAHDLNPRDLTALLYTSGTTANPKGVMLPHTGFCLAPALRARHLGWDERERVLVVNPLFHVNGLIQSCFAAIAAGATVLLRQRFSASGFWVDVRTNGATTTCGMQTIPRILIARDPSPDDVENPMKTLIGVLPPSLFEQFEDRFGVTLVPAYSLTEDPMSVLNLADRARRRPLAAGVPVGTPEHQLKIVGPDDDALEPGEPGQIVKRSPAMMLGYFEKPEETRDALRDGWLYTGDVGYLDDAGFLYFLDRTKDVIRRSGEMVSSSEVESILSLEPRVRAVAVVAVPDEIRGDEIKAVIVSDAPDRVAFAEALWTLCDEELAAFKVPRYIEFRDSLPVTANLKVRKELLRSDGELGEVYWRPAPGSQLERRQVAGPASRS